MAFFKTFTFPQSTGTAGQQEENRETSTPRFAQSQNLPKDTTKRTQFSEVRIMNCNNRSGLNPLTAFYTFYKAPITKFMANIVRLQLQILSSLSVFPCMCRTLCISLILVPLQVWIIMIFVRYKLKESSLFFFRIQTTIYHCQEGNLPPYGWLQTLATW